MSRCRHRAPGGGPTVTLRPGVPPDVLDVGCDARGDGAGSADPLERGRDLTVVQAGIISAVAADDLVFVGVAAFWPSSHDADRPPPQHHCPARIGLSLVIHAWPPCAVGFAAGFRKCAAARRPSARAVAGGSRKCRNLRSGLDSPYIDLTPRRLRQHPTNGMKRDEEAEAGLYRPRSRGSRNSVTDEHDGRVSAWCAAGDRGVGLHVREPAARWRRAFR